MCSPSSALSSADGTRTRKRNPSIGTQSRSTRNKALARFGLGVLRAREGNLAAAEYEFRASLESRPEEPQTHAALGDVLLRQRRFEPALSALQRARQLDPTDGASRILAAVALAELGRFPEAWAAVHEARDLGAEPPERFLAALRAKHPEPGR